MSDIPSLNNSGAVFVFDEMIEIPDAKADGTMKLIGGSAVGCCRTVPRLNVAHSKNENVLFNKSFGYFTSCGCCCIKELGKDTLILTDRKIVISKVKNIQEKCCGIITLTDYHIEATTERPLHTLNGIWYPQIHGPATCYIPNPRKEIYWVPIGGQIAYCADFIGGNLNIECCQFDRGHEVGFFFNGFYPELVTVPSADFVDSIRKLEALISKMGPSPIQQRM